MLLFDMHADFFFSEFVLQRNRYIRSAELFEESSILLLSRCLEARYAAECAQSSCATASGYYWVTCPPAKVVHVSESFDFIFR